METGGGGWGWGQMQCKGLVATPSHAAGLDDLWHSNPFPATPSKIQDKIGLLALAAHILKQDKTGGI